MKFRFGWYPVLAFTLMGTILGVHSYAVEEKDAKSFVCSNLAMQNRFTHQSKKRLKLRSTSPDLRGNMLFELHYTDDDNTEAGFVPEPVDLVLASNLTCRTLPHAPKIFVCLSLIKKIRPDGMEEARLVRVEASIEEKMDAQSNFSATQKVMRIAVNSPEMDAISDERVRDGIQGFEASDCDWQSP